MEMHREVQKHQAKIKRQRLRTAKKKESIWGIIMISPYLLNFLFFAVTLVASLYFSLTKYDLLTPPKWVGVENYVKMVHQPLFWHSFWNTVYLTVLFVPTQTFFALILAVALNQKLKFLKLYRMAHFIPVISSWAVIKYVADAIFNPRFGIANQILTKFGIPEQSWLNDEKLVIPLLVLVAVWKGVGYIMIIFLAGLQNIPDQLYEAADIDGAGTIKKFLKITIPMISSTTFLVLILSTITTFQAFEQIYVMTGGIHDPSQMGGPNNASLVLMLYLYRQGFTFSHMGYASAIAWFLFILLLTLTILQIAFQRKWVHYEK